MELIDNLPECLYYTRYNEIDDFLDRKGKEGELFEHIFSVFSRYGMNTDEIIEDVNYACRNCTEIFLRTHPEYTYDCTCRRTDYLPLPVKSRHNEQCATLILIKCQPQSKKSKRIGSLIEKMDNELWGNGENMDELDQEITSIFNNNYYADIDIDFSPHPDMAAVRIFLGNNSDLSHITNEYNYKKIEFLINLMRTKEDKLMLLDAIDNAHKDYILASLDPTDDLPF